MSWIAAGATLIFALAVSVGALATSPLGGPLREWLFDSGYGVCSPEWLELAQLFPAVGAVAASGAGLVKASRASQFRRPWLFVLLAMSLLVVWATLMGIGGCGIAGDDS